MTGYDHGMSSDVDYTADEWPAAAGHFPLSACSQDELLLLHRHWMWADQQRESFEHHPPTPEQLAGPMASLADVLEHYNRAAAAPAGHTELKPLKLNGRELRQLEAFLRSLSGGTVQPASLSQ